jgi:glucose/mannose-6-phosphate isomerase
MPAARVVPAGEARMWELAASFPRQLRDGQKAVPRHNFAERPGLPIAVVGMGGSGIAGELVANLAAGEAESPVLPLRDFALPGWVSSHAASVFVSYSGNTAETLAAYDEAGRRGVPRAAIASGGELITRAKRDKVLHVQIPAGQPPRSSLGYLLGGLIGILRHAIPSLERDLAREADALGSRATEYAGEGAAPARLAEAWGARGDLWVYAPQGLAAVARRWSTQIEENAKRMAHFDTVPELLHNAVVGWSEMGREDAERRFVVVLRPRSAGEAISRQLDFVIGLMKERGARVVEVTSSSRSPLGEALDLVWQGDYVSLHAARRLGVDPLPVAIIERLKAALAAPPTGSPP